MKSEYDNLTVEEWRDKLVGVACAYKQQFGRALPIPGELGEIYACSILKLERERDGKKGFDAVDSEDNRVQIKSRAPSPGKGTIPPSGTLGRFHSWEFDYALLVLLKQDYEVQEIWRAERKELEAAQQKVNNPRSGIHLSTFRSKNVGKRIYPR